jgi:hypothetical protein
MKTDKANFSMCARNPEPLGEIVVQDAMTESERITQNKIDAVLALGGLPGFVAMLFQKVWQPSRNELTRRWNSGEFRTIRPTK